MSLYHRPQRYLYGCLYHSLYALTGDETWLEYVDDLSEPRWLARLHEAGATVLTYYAALLTDTRTTWAFWEKLRDNMPSGTDSLPLLVTCDGLSGMRHVVAVEFGRNGDVKISDSALDGLRSMSFNAFVTSTYADAYQVQQLLLADLSAYPHESGAEYVSQIDAAPYAPM